MEEIVDDDEALDVDDDSDEVLLVSITEASDEVVVADVTSLVVSVVVGVGNMVMLIHVGSLVGVITCRPSTLHSCQVGVKASGRCFIIQYGVLVAKTMSVKDERCATATGVTPIVTSSGMYIDSVPIACSLAGSRRSCFMSLE